MDRTVVTRSEHETESLGQELAAELTESDVVYLIGELGAGKTTLARGLAAGLGAVAREVASPSFAILHEYAAPDGMIVMRHLDLYRLADRASELAVLGLPDVVAGTPVAVEWPRNALALFLPATVEITIESEADGVRRIAVRRVSPRPASAS